jgi:F420H(2)-dependent quinone reductase
MLRWWRLNVYPRLSNWMVRRIPGFARLSSRNHARLVRLSRGRLGKRFLGAPMLLLRTTGRRSGKMRETPALFLSDGGRYVVVASNAASPRTPGWYYNLIAAGGGEVVIGGRSEAVSAEVASGAEQQRLLALFNDLYGGLAHYQQVAEREMPVVVLTPRENG